jgi:flagellar secretion chaperone FliS
MDPLFTYREASVAGASPVHLVVLLYQQLIDDMRKALDFLRKGNVEARTHEIDHALQIIGHLQATLDKGQGGKVAENLERFYEQLRRGLIEAQCKQSETALETQISHVLQVCDAWCAVERAVTSDSRAAGTLHGQKSGDWSA